MNIFRKIAKHIWRKKIFLVLYAFIFFYILQSVPIYMHQAIRDNKKEVKLIGLWEPITKTCQYRLFFLSNGKLVIHKKRNLILNWEIKNESYISIYDNKILSLISSNRIKEFSSPIEKTEEIKNFYFIKNDTLYLFKKKWIKIRKEAIPYSIFKSKKTNHD